MNKYLGKLMIKIIICLAFIIPIICMADSTYTGKITKIFAGASVGTKVYFTLDGQQTNKPSCSTSNSYNYVFDGATDTGKILLSMGLSEYAANKEIKIGGYETCNLASNVEDLKWLTIQ